MIKRIKRTIKGLIRYFMQKKDKIRCEYDVAGFGKTIYIMNDYVVGYYKDSSLYELAKKNYQSFCDSFVFPSAKIIAFDDCWRTITMERVFGTQYEDREHDYLVINSLFEYALESPVRTEKNGECTYLQHGDAKRGNIIWTNSSSFVFVDLDNISFRPLLFDVLHYCAMAEMSFEEIVSIIQANIKVIRNIFERFNLVFDDNYLDNILYHYSLFFFRLRDCYEDLAFMNTENTKNLPKTNALMGILNV